MYLFVNFVYILSGKQCFNNSGASPGFIYILTQWIDTKISLCVEVLKWNLPVYFGCFTFTWVGLFCCWILFHMKAVSEPTTQNHLGAKLGKLKDLEGKLLQRGKHPNNKCTWGLCRNTKHRGAKLDLTNKADRSNGCFSGMLASKAAACVGCVGSTRWAEARGSSKSSDRWVVEGH